MSAAPDQRIGLGLNEQLCFALYAASRVVSGRYRPMLGDVGLTFPQYLVMLVLWEEQVITVSALGKRLYLDSATLSPLLKRLEAVGVLERRRRTDDERSVQVILTPQGEEMRSKVECFPPRVAEATGLEHEDLVRMRDALHAMTEYMVND